MLCICRRTSGLTLAFTIDTFKIAFREGEPAPYSVPRCPSFPPVLPSLSVSYKLCCWRPATQSLVLQTRVPATSYPPAIFSFLCIFPSCHQALHFPAPPPCLLEHLTPLLFLLPNRTYRETCRAPTAVFDCWRKQHCGFLPLSPGSARRSHWCCYFIAAFPDCVQDTRWEAKKNHPPLQPQPSCFCSLPFILTLRKQSLYNQYQDI